MDSISIGMTRAGWRAKMAQVGDELASAEAGQLNLTFFGRDNDTGDQVAITFNDDDMIAGENGRTDDECYVEVA